jgi:nitrogen-specific signal transduction histidine kinase/ActR/RegA family two-component response regulator
MPLEGGRLLSEDEERLFERQMHQFQRMESLGQLAGGVAHDFSNLLSVIANYSIFVDEVLASSVATHGGNEWKQARKDIAQISLAAERGIRLTKQLLAFASHEKVSSEVVNLNEVILETKEILRRTIGEQIELVTILDPDLGYVLADSGQMEQVLMNLAVNSRDAIAEAGVVTIETMNRTIDTPVVLSMGRLCPPGKYVCMKVSDNGSGMSPEVLDRAFEPFFTTKAEGEGSGFGLATVYGIMSQTGGCVEIESHIDRGTVVTVMMLVTVEEVAPSPTEGDRKRSKDGDVVLLVEDEPAMREVTKRLIERHGYRVLSASGGEAALAMASAYKAKSCLIVSDVVMPHMLGKELVQKLRQVRPDIRVLYMSGWAESALSAKGSLDPGAFLMAKPFSEDDLMSAVNDVMSDRSHVA